MLNTIYDRVQQSQEHHQAQSHDKATLCELHTTSSTPIPRVHEELAQRNPPSLGQTIRPSPFFRYDPETLIELGREVQESPEVLLKVKPEAIAG